VPRSKRNVTKSTSVFWALQEVQWTRTYRTNLKRRGDEHFFGYRALEASYNRHLYYDCVAKLAMGLLRT